MALLHTIGLWPARAGRSVPAPDRNARARMTWWGPTFQSRCVGECRGRGRVLSRDDQSRFLPRAIS